MAGMGPAGKPADQRARRNATVAMTKLPQSGRSGRAPAWPLAVDVELEFKIEMAKRLITECEDEISWCTVAKDRAAARRRLSRAKKQLGEAEAMRKVATKAEREIWAALWKTPQATQWEKRGWFREVGLYARHQAKAEAGSLDDSKEARQREDRLGLNDMSMLRLKWEIVDDSAAAKAPTPRSKRNSSKYKGLTVVAS